jgi:hypothetical protein
MATTNCLPLPTSQSEAFTTTPTRQEPSDGLDHFSRLPVELTEIIYAFAMRADGNFDHSLVFRSGWFNVLQQSFPAVTFINSLEGRLSRRVFIRNATFLLHRDHDHQHLLRIVKFAMSDEGVDQIRHLELSTTTCSLDRRGRRYRHVNALTEKLEFARNLSGLRIVSILYNMTTVPLTQIR